MKWEEQADGRYKSDAGYLITPSKAYGKDQYTAWGPFDAGWKSRLKVHYEIGETIPQPHELLGTWSSLAKAKAACKKH